MSFLCPKHLSNRNEVMTLNFCLFKIKITNSMARTGFQMVPSAELGYSEPYCIPSYVPLKQKC